MAKGLGGLGAQKSRFGLPESGEARRVLSKGATGTIRAAKRGVGGEGGAFRRGLFSHQGERPRGGNRGRGRGSKAIIRWMCERFGRWTPGELTWLGTSVIRWEGAAGGARSVHGLLFPSLLSWLP